VLDRKQFFQAISAAFAAAAVTGEANAEPIESGKLYVLELPNLVDLDTVLRIKKSLAPYEKRFNIQFLVLQPGASIYQVDLNPKQIAKAVGEELKKQGLRL